MQFRERDYVILSCVYLRESLDFFHGDYSCVLCEQVALANKLTSLSSAKLNVFVSSFVNNRELSVESVIVVNIETLHLHPHLF